MIYYVLHIYILNRHSDSWQLKSKWVLSQVLLRIRIFGDVSGRDADQQQKNNNNFCFQPLHGTWHRKWCNYPPWTMHSSDPWMPTCSENSRVPFVNQTWGISPSISTCHSSIITSGDMKFTGRQKHIQYDFISVSSVSFLFAAPVLLFQSRFLSGLHKSYLFILLRCKLIYMQMTQICTFLLNLNDGDKHIPTAPLLIVWCMSGSCSPLVSLCTGSMSSSLNPISQDLIS